ncbi:hypothetical protein MPSEU_000036600 [Mayamaea pseudoterrestris]|nr:hypothetical protein MPSEU_000036600 [Mayamaea pseudoterrestris]
MPSSSNKLAYLSSKYLEDPKQKKKKKKHKKGSRRRHDNDDDSNDTNHDFEIAFLNEPEEPDDFGDDYEEEGPVVVDTSEIANTLPTAAGPVQTTSSNPPFRRQRHDSSDSDQSAIVQKQPSTMAKRRQRHDSDSDQAESNQGAVHKRQRHDSSSDEGDVNSGNIQRRRYDSSSDNGEDEDDEKIVVNQPAKARKRHDSFSSDASGERRSKKARRRHDSNSSSEDHSEAARRVSHSRRQRHDSDDSSDDSSNGKSNDSRDRLSTGHKAGLQTSDDFAKQQAKTMKRTKREAQATVDKHGMGETVYRDKHGCRQTQSDALDAQHEARRLALQKQQDQLALNMGTKQKQALQQQQEEITKLASAGFARHADDDELESLRKSAIREGDPMAPQAARQSKKQFSGGGGPSKRLYSGPPPKPNRFNIRPGFRWDGIDRGNGFEDKLLARQYMKQHQAEQAHMWSTRDM